MWQYSGRYSDKLLYTLAFRKYLSFFGWLEFFFVWLVGGFFRVQVWFFSHIQIVTTKCNDFNSPLVFVLYY